MVVWILCYFGDFGDNLDFHDILDFLVILILFYFELTSTEDPSVSFRPPTTC